MKKVVFVVSLLVIGLLLVSACAAPKEKAPAAPAPKEEKAPAAPAPEKETAPVPAPKGEVATALDAKKLYDANCAVCHGPNRQGISGLGLPLTPESLSKLSDDEIKNTILKGRLNTAMVGFEGHLSAEEINALIQLIKYSSP